MPPPFGLPPLRIEPARLYRSVGGFAWLLLVLAAARIHPSSVFCLFRATARFYIFGGGQAFGALRQWSAVRPLGAGPVARALGSALGAPTPRGSPRATPGERLSLRSVFVGSRQPPTIRGTRHGRCVPRLQGAAALRGRVSGGWRLGRASARARFSLGGLPLLSVAGRLWDVPGSATLRSGHPIGLLPCGRPPRARRGRRTPLSSRRRPKRFCPLEPLTPHAACARTRPRFARPLPRFRGLAPRGSLAAVGSLSD